MDRPTVIATLPATQGGRLRVALDKVRGRRVVDIRVVTELAAATDLWVPIKQGVAVEIEQLAPLIQTLTEALARVAEMAA